MIGSARVLAPNPGFVSWLHDVTSVRGIAYIPDILALHTERKSRHDVHLLYHLYAAEYTQLYSSYVF